MKVRSIVFFVRHASHLANHVDPYAKYITGRNIQLVVFHTSSLTKELGGNYDNSGRNYELFDISNMEYQKINNLLKEINPLGIVFYNFLSLFDVLMNRMAKKNNIHTLYMEHGILNEIHSVRYNILSIGGSMKRYLKISLKYLGFLMSYPAKIVSEIRLIFNIFLRKKFEQIKCDSAIFYSKEAFLEMNKIFKFSPDKVAFSGYPIFDTKQEARLANNQVEKHFVLFIHQPVIMAKLTKIDYNEEFIFIIKHAEILKPFSYKLVVQIHPRESLQMYQKGLFHENIEVIQERDMAKLVAKCSFVIGMYSTALFYAIYLNKPILITKYPEFKYDYTFYFKEVGVLLSSPDDLKKELENQSYSRKMAAYPRYKSRYLGENNSFEERAEAILNVFVHQSK